MNYKMLARILGIVLLCLAGLLLLPAVCALIYHESPAAYLISAAAAAVPGVLLWLVKPERKDLYAREGLTAVGLAWIVMSALGAVPFVLTGDIPRYVDAFFETVSGFTTTGASILANVEEMSRAGLFWRSFTHWIGGMGVLVFVLAVLPMDGSRSMHIMRAEVPGPVVGKLVPRAKKTAMILYGMYAALTVLETIALMIAGLSFYDALLHAFGSAGTGGFSTRAASVGAFNSCAVEMIIAVFLVLFGTNFNLYYLVLIGRAKDALKSEELRWYLGIIAGMTLIIAAGISRAYGSFGTGLRHAFFNVISLLSTAGFGTEDFTRWPQYVQALLVLLMFVGGCAGSTGGGLKLSRVMLLLKNGARDVGAVVSPRRVRRVRMDGSCVEDGTVQSAAAYFILYIVILLAGAVLLSFDGYDYTVNFTASLSCISNVGPGLSLIGPSGNYAIFSDRSKLIMALIMILGRLEIYPVLVLLNPANWLRRGR